MTDSNLAPLTILCLASSFKGAPFLEECKRLGCRVVVLTRQKEADYPWPHEAIDELFFMPTLFRREETINAVAYLARTQRLDRIVALDDMDVEIGAALREHLRVPGMGDTTARFFRDKLAMRLQARERGIRVPEFVPVVHYETLAAWMDQVPAPWVLKPRSEASAVGILKLYDAEAVWRALDTLGDRQSYYVLERYVPGRVFHVDGLVWEGRLGFAEVHQYATPPLDVMQGGGIFCSHTVARTEPPAIQLRALTAHLVEALGLVRGATHTEFILGDDGEFYFLEAAARVGGANIPEMVEAATGVNLWQEWARLEVAKARGLDYEPPAARKEYAGILISLARQEYTDTSAYDDPEIAWRMSRRHHVGLIVTSPDLTRVEALLAEYQHRFAHDFHATLPAPTTLTDG